MKKQVIQIVVLWCLGVMLVNGQTNDVAMQTNATVNLVESRDEGSGASWLREDRKHEELPVRSEGFPWRPLLVSAVLLAVLVGVHYWLKRRQHHGGLPGRGERLRVRERMMLGPRRAVLLLEADGHRLVIADGADRTVLLADLGRAPEGASDSFESQLKTELPSE